ncbi:MAG TPA: amidohydrolase [Thermoanaerobaculia bacterium]|nr:amidohydrolase [Thermoanaerobaculia bacterium]
MTKQSQAMAAALSAVLVFGLAMAARAASPGPDAVDAVVDAELPSLVATYKALHAAPELSHHEEKTSALVASELRALGFTVTDHVGKYPERAGASPGNSPERAGTSPGNSPERAGTSPGATAQPGWQGYGVVAVLNNGQGPTVLVRSDLDALPVEEKTGLPYASTVRTKNESGQDVAVMHACGHDIHIASLLGTARALVALKDRWHGTLVLVGQPAEETIDGAKALLDDGLYRRIPKPDYALALHDNSELEAGRVGWGSGYVLASSTSVDIVVRGIGSHGSRPEAGKDPVVLAAQIVLALQTIVSRENSPLDPAVVTVGTIHGGAKRNIIPDQVVLELTVRAYREEVRRRLLAAIERIARGTALAAGLPENLLPIVKVSETEVTGATYNDPALTRRLAGVFVQALGAGNVVELPPVMGSEDFGRFGLDDHQIPTCMFFVGAVDPAKVARARQTGTPLPSLHSSLFAPLPEPTIRTAVKSMTSAVLELMQ